MKRGKSHYCLTLLVAVMAALGLAACGSGKKHSTAALAPLPEETLLDVAGIEAELAAMQVPDGVRPEVWQQVKEGFWREWQRAQEGKEALADSTNWPPDKVDWIYAVHVGTEHGSEPDLYIRDVDLRWRYKNVGDFNLNGCVQMSDLTVFAQQLGRMVAEHPELEALDTDGNGAVDISDLSAFARNYGGSCTAYGIMGATSVEGPWIELGSVGIGLGEKLEFRRQFSYVVRLEYMYPSEQNHFPDNIGILSVVPYGKDRNEGVRSPSTSAYYYSAGISPNPTYVLCGTPKQLAGPFEDPSAFVRWEFEGSVPPGVQVDGGQLTFHEPGDYEFWSLVFGGEVMYRRDYHVVAIAVSTTPTTMSYIPTPQGPLLYWSRAGTENVLTGSTVLRDGQPIAEPKRDAYYYLDYRAGLETHTYQVRGMREETLVYFTEEVMASGEQVEGEHLYVVAEPKEYIAEENLNVLVALVNNRYRLWMIPSLRIYVEGGEVDRDVMNLADELAKAASVAWPPTELTVPIPGWPFSDEHDSGTEVSAGVGVLNWAGYGLPIPPTTPPGRTILLKPSGGSIEGGPGTTLRPYMNQGLPLSFYIDAYRNMHLFEYGHSFNLSTHEVGPAEASPPYDGRLSLGKPPLPGDFNQDGYVGINDITPFAIYWGQPVTEETTFLDENDDGVISLLDFMYILYYFGRTNM